MRWLVIVIGFAGCTRPPAKLEGMWERDDEDGRRIERLELVGERFILHSTDGTFEEEILGTWQVHPLSPYQLVFDGLRVGTSPAKAATLVATHYFDHDELVIGAFVDEPNDGWPPIARHRADDTRDLAVVLRIDALGFEANDWGTTQQRDSGPAEFLDDDTVVLDDRWVYRIYDDGSMGTDDPATRMFGPARIMQMTTTFHRVD